MSIVANYIVPTIKVMLTLAFTGLSGFGIFKAIRSLFPKEITAWFKFRILRKEYPEEDVEWCLDCWEKGASIPEVLRHLRLTKVQDQKVEEIMFIFKKITKLKGGQKSNGRRQTRKGSLETFRKG